MSGGRAYHVAAAAICLLLALLSMAFGTGTDASQSEDETALRALVARYYDAIAARDLDGAIACWSDKSPRREPKLQEMKQRFVQTGKVEVAILNARRLRSEGDKASLRVDIETRAASGNPISIPSKLTFDLEFVREGGRWGIWKEELAQTGLGNRLAALGTKEERAALLTAEGELKSPSLCQALAWQGGQLRRRGEYPRAREIFDLALTVADEIGDKGGQADALHGLGRLLLAQGKGNEAVDYYQKGLALREQLNDRARIAESLSGIAGVYATQGKSEQALELERKSLKLREAGGVPAEIADGLARMGYIYRTRDDDDNALDYYRKSLALSSDAGDKEGAAWMRREIGLIHYRQGNYLEALTYYDQSLKLYRELANHGEVAQILYNTGVVYRALADFDRALDSYGQSLRIRQEIGDRFAVSNCLLSIANVHGQIGNYSKALEYYQQSLEIKKALNDQIGIAQSLHGMANVYIQQGRPDRGLAFLEDSLAIYRSSGQKRGIAAALDGIAAAHMVLGNYDRALEVSLNAQALYEELKDRAGIAKILGNIGLVLLHRKEPMKALEPLGRSLAMREELGDKFGISLTLAWIAMSHSALGNDEQAVTLATRAADMARTIQARFALWQACTALGDAYRTLRQPERARVEYEEAVRVIEELRGEVAGDESERAGFLANKLSPYYGLVGLELDQSRGESALSYAERVKGRVLLEVMQNGRVEIESSLSAAEREEERNRVAAVVSLNGRLSLAVQRPNPDKNRIAGLRADLEKARFEREALETNVYAAHPEIRVNRGELSIPSAAEAARLLPGAAGAFLEFVVTERTTHLFVVTQKGMGEGGGALVHYYTIDLPRAELDQRVEHFRKQVAERALDCRASAADLFRLLLGPARDDLKGRNAIVIVPDGSLWDLPFQALVSDGKYLWERYEISYAPSIAVLRETVRLHERRAAERKTPPTLLVMGNGSPQGGTGTTTGTLDASRGFALPVTEDQMTQIGALYGTRAQVYLRSDATEARFKQEAGSFDIIHLATHGILVDLNPMYSHLVLSPGAGEDGELEAREILRLHLKADLVVLSACETARGRASAGEGMIGLCWALFVAGCPAAVVSQWRVDAAATTSLMVGFHKRLQAGRSRISSAAALRQAALEVLRDPRYRHPYYWAGFILVGDGY